MDTKQILKDLSFTAVRSGGPGGQHANKVSSKVQLSFDIQNSKVLSEEKKQLLLEKLRNRLTKENILIMTNEETRSQHQNKERLKQNFLELIENSLRKRRIRKATKPSKSSVRQRLKKKKKHAFKKVMRKKPDLT